MIIKVHCLGFWVCIRVKPILKGKSEANEALHVHERETTLAVHVQAFQVILMLFQVFIMSMKYPRSNTK